MKNADTTSIPEKKMRFSNAKVIDISRGERKKLRAIRRIKAPVTRKGAYLQLTYKVRNRDVADLLDRAERTRSRVTVFSSLFDPGAQLLALGGIAAILRYRMK
jgi:peptide subunit release factor 1 (eRF1)